MKTIHELRGYINHLFHGAAIIYFEPTHLVKACTVPLYFLMCIGILSLADATAVSKDFKIFASAASLYIWAFVFFILGGLRTFGLIANESFRTFRLAVPIIAIWLWVNLFLSAIVYSNVEPIGLHFIYIQPALVEMFILSRVFYDDHYSGLVEQYYPKGH